MTAVEEPAVDVTRVWNFTPRRTVDSRACVGRQPELRELIRSSVSNDALVRLVGPRGIGRTTFLRYAADVIAKRGRGFDFKDDLRDNTAAAYVELDPREADGVRKRIAAAITGVMGDGERALILPADLERSPLEELGRVMRTSVPQKRWLLLLDRCEHLLGPPGERAPWANEALEAVGMLNEYVPAFGVCFAFGVGGPVKDLDLVERERLEVEFMQTTSEVLGLAPTRIRLGLLPEPALRDYAERAVVEPPSGDRPVKLDADEVEWLLDLAGGHPYVLHFVGRMCGQLKSSDPVLRRSRTEIEKDACDGLQGFVGAAWRRIAGAASHEDAAARQRAMAEAARRVAADEAGALVERALALALHGEGLTVADADSSSGLVECRMPSRALRAALAAHLDHSVGVGLFAGSADDAERAWPVFPDHAEIPPFYVAAVDREGRVRTVRLTRSEWALYDALFPGEVVSRGRLRKALEKVGAGGPVVDRDHQVTQRLSVLRTKLVRLGVEEPIETIYGEGYRLRDPAGFRAGPR